MPDLIGQTLGQHRIVEKIGAGGMATVYQAQPDRDATLARSPPAAKSTFPWPWLAGCGVLTAVVILCLAMFVIGWMSRDRFAVVQTPTHTPHPPTPTPSPTPDSRRIAFTSNRDDNSEIYLINADGSELTNLTNNPADDQQPNWSPDGKRIAFSSDRDGNQEIYVINADGSEVTRLTNNLAPDYYPLWSPDGQLILFETVDEDTNGDGSLDYWDDAGEIYVINVDGTGQVNLSNHPADDQQPDWSPDGKQITFFSDRDGNWEIYVMNADGSSQANLTNYSNLDQDPVWSPDGTRIAFSRFITLDNVGWEIHTMNPAGSGLTRLTDHPDDSLAPVWSPDSQHIAFRVGRGGKPEIYVVNTDGSEQINLTNNPAADWNPAWSPDGTQLTFYSTRDDPDPENCGRDGNPECNSEIYVVSADGSDLTRLTNNPARDRNPKWSP
jgi:Tol biopolymer transport system component